jgi:hypothetical protein
MGATVRVCLFGQYERDYQNTLPQYMDDYFNNGTGNHVKDPHPVSYYLWGTGPAVYYGTVNLWVESNKSWFKDQSFEGYDLKPGTAALAPQGGAWKFEGGAGVVDVRYPRCEAVAQQPAGKTVTLDKAQVVGFQFTVGPKDIYVYELGRRMLQGDRGAVPVSLCRADGKNLPVGRPEVAVELKDTKAGETAYGPLRYSAWATKDSHRVGLYRLEAGQSYVVLGSEAKGAKVPAPDTKLDPGPGLAIDGGVRASSVGKKGGVEGEVEKVSGPGTGFGHVTFRYTTQVLEPSKGMVVVPPDPAVDPAIAKGGLGKSNIPREVRTGTRMAFIAGKGALSQEFTIAEPSDYALILSGAHGHTGDNALTITLGTNVVWQRELLQGARKPKHAVFNYGTHYVHLAPGQYTLRIEGTSDDPAAVTYIDGVHLGDLLDYFGGTNAANFLGAGEATGQTESRFSVVSKLTTAEALNWGTVPIAYEGGFNAGGDWNGGNVFYAFQSKWEHPLSTVADNNWARFWHAHGGFNAMYYYPAFPDSDMANTEKYAPWCAARDRAKGWELEPSEGLKVPGKLTCADPHCQGEPGSRWDGWYHPFQKNGHNKGTKLNKGQWKAWIVLAPEAREYAITGQIAGTGAARWSVDGDAPLTGRVFLTKGVHSLKVKAEAGAIEIASVKVE